jgi:hypothetical protein
MLNHPNKSIVGKLSLLAMVVIMVFGLGGGTAIAQVDAPQQEAPAYLITTGLPNLQSIEIPSMLDDEAAQRLSGKIMVKRSAELRHELRKLEQQGLIANIEPLGNGTYRLNVLDPSALTRLGKLESAGALQKDEGEVPACFDAAQAKLPEMLVQTSKMQIFQQAQIEEANINPAALKIEIYFNLYFDWTYVHGSGAAPNSEVKLSILRGGAELTYDYTLSDSSGNYIFYPDYQYCPEEHYAWTIMKGDTIKVTSGGVTSQTVAAPISGWANPVNNVVSGATSPNRSIRLTISQINRANPCGYEPINTKTGAADPDGNFSINTTSVIDFDRSASVMLETPDANGHKSYSYADTVRLMAFIWDYVYGSYLPSQPYTLVLKRGAETLETLDETTDDDGWFFNDFDADVQEGDKVIFTSGSFSMDYTVVDISSLSINRATGQVRGVATPGMLVMAARYPEENVAITRCYDRACSFEPLPSGGDFDLTLGEAYKGEDIIIYLITPEGEMISYADYEAAIGANITYNGVNIYWPYYRGALTVTLKDSGGVELETTHAYREGSYSDYYYAWFSKSIGQDNIIEVTDGEITETMTVQALSQPRLNYNSNRLTGGAPAGLVVAEIVSRELYTCKEAVSDGSYNIDPGWDVKADESAFVSFRGQDGHYTNGDAMSFSMFHAVGTDSVEGQFEASGPSLDWTHKRGPSSIGSGKEFDKGGGYFHIPLSEIPLPGDVLEVTTEDDNSASMTFPSITENRDPVGRRVYGQAIPNRPVSLYLNRETADGTFYSYFDSYSSAAGQYSISLPKDVAWDFNCSAVDLAHPCIAMDIYTITAEGFHISFSKWPESAPPDTFETDDIYSHASIYSGLQNHSLHQQSDEDWIKFTVTQEDVDQAHNFHFNTIQIGWNMDLYMELYDMDGATFLTGSFHVNDDGTGQGPQLYYTFSTPGEYYLRIHSMPHEGDQDGGYCDSVYTLIIFADEQFLYMPMINR